MTAPKRAPKRARILFVDRSPESQVACCLECGWSDIYTTPGKAHEAAKDHDLERHGGAYGLAKLTAENKRRSGKCSE